MSKTLEYVKEQIVILKDDLQHYTTVEKDRALEKQTRYELENLTSIEQELKAFDILKPLVKLEVFEDGYYITYTLGVGKERVEISREEYDLLKEVLL